MIIFNLLVPPASVFAVSASDALVGIAVKYYDQGYYAEALHEFSKVLLIEPDNEQARAYIRKIRLAQQGTRADKINHALDEFEQVTKITSLPYARSIVVNRELAKASKPRKGLPGQERYAKKEEAKTEIPYLDVKGNVQIAAGVRAPEEVIWKEANGDLNERNFRIVFGEARHNTYDPAIFDRLRLNLNTKNLDKLGIDNLNAHADITVDPWSFTGKSDKFTIAGDGGDLVELQLKYWSNTSRAINEIYDTLLNGDSLATPEIKVIEGVSVPATVRTTFGNIFTIPATDIDMQFMPVREFWLDYNEDEYHWRFFPIAYQDQALTTGDPLKLSNNHTWWEESPWLADWKPGNLNTGATPDDFTKGSWDDSLAFFTRDSDGLRLTALRGAAFKYDGIDTDIESTFASPKNLWADYGEFNTFATGTRLSHDLFYNLSLGLTHAGHFGYKEGELDGLNNVFSLDFKHEPFSGTKILGQVAGSEASLDRTNSIFRTRKNGNAYFFSLVNRFPKDDIYDKDYFAVSKNTGEKSFLKSRFNFAHMDEGFESSLANYRQTRDDEFWSRHISFRKHPLYLYSGTKTPMSFDDIRPFAIGNGIDYGRDVIGLRLEGETQVFDRDLDGLFDVRNVHEVEGGFVENVTRAEMTYDLNDRVITKFLALRHDLPVTIAGVDPFIFDDSTGRNLVNTAIIGGEDPSLRTLSAGFEYKSSDQLSFNAVYEFTNDSTVATDNYPRGLFNSSSFTTTTENGLVFREPIPFLFSQQFFDLPPYDYFDIYKVGVSFRPVRELEFYLDLAYNDNRKAGQIDDNMNHFGLEIAYQPSQKLSFLFKYTASRWIDLFLLNATGREVYAWHQNVFLESRYHLNQDSEFIFEYGVGGITPLGSATYDPFGGALAVLDTQHILRLYYTKKF